MNFEWSLFEFTKNDCLNLAKYVKSCSHLKILRLRRSKVSDERARLLISYLLDHPGLETLGKQRVYIFYFQPSDRLVLFNLKCTIDLSHNKLGDASGRALGKLLNGRCSLRSLDVSDNMIGSVGGTSIGRALENSNLEYLNLRLNR